MNTRPERIKALREELVARGLSGFYVPLTDEHMSEYVGDYAQRLAWVSGFEGSAGSAMVMTDGPAAIFVDGRYTIQVRDEVDASVFEIHDITDMTPATWLAGQASAGDRIGFDPELDRKRFQVTEDGVVVIAKNTKIELPQ